GPEGPLGGRVAPARRQDHRRGPGPDLRRAGKMGRVVLDPVHRRHHLDRLQPGRPPRRRNPGRFRMVGTDQGPHPTLIPEGTPCTAAGPGLPYWPPSTNGIWLDKTWTQRW